MKQFIIAFLFISAQVTAQVPSPGQSGSKPVILTGGTAHIGNGQVIENAAIGIENGKITFVRPMGSIRLDAENSEIIDVTGKHIYPGFINPNNTLGLTEIEAVRATNDFAETGAFNPEVRALTSFNTDSRIAPTVRSNGVLMTQVTPRSGRISGTSSIMNLDGWNWEDAVLKADDGIHINWPWRFQRSGWWAEPGPTKANENYDAQVDELRQFLLRAKAYAESPTEERNQKLESCRGLFKGSQHFYIHVNEAKGIMESVLFAKELGIGKPVVVGASEAWVVTDFLAVEKVPVILHRTHSLPDKEDDHVDQPFKTAKALYDSKVTFCFSYEGDMEAMGSRNLPFSAGTAVTYGVPYEEAVKALTGNAAEILGISAKVGTLETGKQATLFVSTGDALDMLTNDVVLAFVNGRQIDLDNPQKALYRKFSGKYAE